VIDRGRLVLQDDLARLGGPTGRVIVRSPDADRAAALLDGQIAHRDADRLVIAHADAAELNSRLVSAGLRVTEVTAERRSLEDLVLSVTGSGSDRVDGRTAGAAVRESGGGSA
jgi:ABC-2 type transport system ATP-binding protein